MESLGKVHRYILSNTKKELNHIEAIYEEDYIKDLVNIATVNNKDQYNDLLDDIELNNEEESDDDDFTPHDTGTTTQLDIKGIQSALYVITLYVITTPYMHLFLQNQFFYY